MVEGLEAGLNAGQLAMAAGVTGVSGFLGAVTGNRVNVEWLKKGLERALSEIGEVRATTAAHHLEIELLKRRNIL